MGLGSQSSKVQTAVWTSLASLMGGAAAWLIGHSQAPPFASLPRDIEAAKQVVEAARKQGPESTLDHGVQETRELKIEVDKLRADRAADNTLICRMWVELYESESRRVQLEARLRQPKNKTAAGDVLELFQERAAGWSACPATPQALQELLQGKQPSLHDAADSALRGMKITIER